MMRNPDKWVRKYFVDTLKNMVVSGKSIQTFDTNAPQNYPAFIVLSTQSKTDERDNKCYNYWNCSILIDVVTVYDNVAGSRVLAEDIMEEVMTRTNSGIVVENFDLVGQEWEFPADLSTKTSTQTIHRKLIRFNLKLVEQ